MALQWDESTYNVYKKAYDDAIASGNAQIANTAKTFIDSMLQNKPTTPVTTPAPITTVTPATTTTPTVTPTNTQTDLQKAISDKVQTYTNQAASGANTSPVTTPAPATNPVTTPPPAQTPSWSKIDPNTFKYDTNSNIAALQRKSLDMYNNTGSWDSAEQKQWNTDANALRQSAYGYSGGDDGQQKITTTPTTSTPSTGLGGILGTALNAAGQAIGTATSQIPQATQVAQETKAKADAEIQQTLGADMAKITQDQWNKGDADPAVAALHQKAEAIRAKYGYSGGEDGSQINPLAITNNYGASKEDVQATIDNALKNLPQGASISDVNKIVTDALAGQKNLTADDVKNIVNGALGGMQTPDYTKVIEALANSNTQSAQGMQNIISQFMNSSSQQSNALLQQLANDKSESAQQIKDLMSTIMQGFTGTAQQQSDAMKLYQQQSSEMQGLINNLMTNMQNNQNTYAQQQATQTQQMQDFIKGLTDSMNSNNTAQSQQFRDLVNSMMSQYQTGANQQNQQMQDFISGIMNNVTSANNQNATSINTAISQMLKQLQDQMTAEQDKEAQQTQKNKEFQDYLNNWSSGINRDDYINNAKQIGQDNANLKFDAIAEDLKKRLATMMSGYDNQLNNANNAYQGMYAQNEQDKYNAMSDVKKRLAQRGLLGSGIETGNAQATDLQYANKRQDIDLQKQEQLNNIMNAKQSKTVEGETELNNIAKQKNDYVASMVSQAQKDWQDYDTQQRQFAADNYWKGMDYKLNNQKAQTDLLNMLSGYSLNNMKLGLEAGQIQQNYNLAQQQMEQDAKQFAAQLGLDYDKMNQQDKQFYTQNIREANEFVSQMGLDYAKLSQQDKQFYTDAVMRADEFTKQLGLDYTKLDKQDKQFYAQTALEAQKMASELGLEYDKMAQNERTELNRNMMNAIDMTGRFGLEYSKMNQQDKQFYAQLSQDSTQFAQRLGYDYTKLGAEQKNFYDNLTMQQAQFDSRLRQDASQFATSMGYNYDKMVQENDQFDRQLGFDVEKLKQDNQLESDRLSTQLALGNLDFQASASKLAQEAEQFKQEYGLRADELKRDNRELLLKENDRVDNAIAQLIEEAQNGTIDRTSLAALLPGIVDTSTLDEEAKKAKKKMVNEALGISTSSSVKSLLDNINTNPYYKSSSSSFGTPYKTPSALAQGGTTIRSR